MKQLMFIKKLITIIFSINLVFTSMPAYAGKILLLAVPGEKELNTSLTKNDLAGTNSAINNSADQQEVSQHQMTIFGPGGQIFRKSISEVTLASPQLEPLIKEAKEKIRVLNNPKTFLRLSRDTKCQLLNWLNDHYQILKGLKRDDIPRINLDTCAYYVNHVDRHVRIAMWPLLAQATEGKMLTQQQMRAFLLMAYKDNWQNDAATDRYLQYAMVSLAELHPATYKSILEILKKKKITPRRNVPNNLPEHMTFSLEIEVAAIKYGKNMYYKRKIEPDYTNTNLLFEDWRRTIDRAKQQGLIRKDSNQSYFWNVCLEGDLDHFETKTPVLINKSGDWQELRTVLYLLRQKMHTWQAQGIKFVHTIHIRAGGYPLDAKTRQSVAFIIKAMEYWWKELVGVQRIDPSRLSSKDKLLGDLLPSKHIRIAAFDWYYHTLVFELFPPVFLKAADDSAWALYQKKISMALQILYMAAKAPELFNLLSWGLPVTQDSKLPESKKNHILRHALDRLYGHDIDGKLDFLQLFVATAPSSIRKKEQVTSSKKFNKDHTGRNMYRKLKLESLYNEHFNANGWKDQSRLNQKSLLAQWKRPKTDSENYCTSKKLVVLFHPSHDAREQAFQDLMRHADSTFNYYAVKALESIVLTGDPTFAVPAFKYLLGGEDTVSGKLSFLALVASSCPNITIASQAYDYLATIYKQSPNEINKNDWFQNLFSKKLSRSIHHEIRQKSYLLLKERALKTNKSSEKRKKDISALIKFYLGGTKDIADETFMTIQELIANPTIPLMYKYHILDGMTPEYDYVDVYRKNYLFFKNIVLSQKRKKSKQADLRIKSIEHIRKIIDYSNYNFCLFLTLEGVRTFFEIAEEKTLPMYVRFEAIMEINFCIYDQLINFVEEKNVAVGMLSLKMLMKLAMTYQGYAYKKIRIKILMMLYNIMIDVSQVEVKKHIEDFFKENKKEINSLYQTKPVIEPDKDICSSENFKISEFIRLIGFEQSIQKSQ